MKDPDLYSGIVSPDKQAEHEAWLIENCGPAVKDQIDASWQNWADMSEADRAARMDELRDIEDGLADGLRRGVPPESPILDPLIARHQNWVAVAWGKPCTPQAYAGLAEVYDHFNFAQRYEAIESGFGEYLKAAMCSWAQRQD